MARRHSYHKRRSAQTDILGLLLLAFIGAGIYTGLSTQAKTLIVVLAMLLGVLVVAAGAFLYLMVTARQRQRTQALTISHVDSMSGRQFEQYAVHLLRAQGFRHVEVTKTSGDFGVDVLAVKDGVRWAVQAKCYTHSVGNHAISEAVGGKNHYRCDRTMVVTNNYFTRAAKIQAQDNNTSLIDRDKLAEWIITFQGPNHNK